VVLARPASATPLRTALDLARPGIGHLTNDEPLAAGRRSVVRLSAPSTTTPGARSANEALRTPRVR